MTELIQFLSKHQIQLRNPFAPFRHYERPARGAGARDFEKVSRDMRVLNDRVKKNLQKELTTDGG